MPQSAELGDTQFVAFLANATSGSLVTGAVDSRSEDWEVAYNIDCREFANRSERELFQLPDPIDICRTPIEHETWVDRDAYQVVAGDFVAYRGEALINSEGDFQLAFHHRLPDGEDFRIVIAVDPDFQPSRCQPGEAGTSVVREPLDGDWIAEWSREIEPIADGDAPPGLEYLVPYADGGRLYFLNSNSYHLDPGLATNRTSDDQWIFPTQWRSGAATARFGDDLFEERETRYGEPRVWELAGGLPPGGELVRRFPELGPDPEQNLWLCSDPPVRADRDENGNALPNTLSEGDDPTSNGCMIQLGERIERVADETELELRRLLRPRPGASPVMRFRSIAHLNDWREPDGNPPGLDGWGQLDSSFVVFSEDSVLEVGGSARGAFQVLYEGRSSGSRALVKGTFVAETIERDRWGAGDLFAEKADENEVTLCFEQ